MTDSLAILRSLKAHLDVMDSILQDMRGMIERPDGKTCPICHDSGWMQLDASLVPCACIEAGLDEQRAARGELMASDLEYGILFDAYGICERENVLLRSIVLATYFAPEEGTDVPVFRVPSKEMDAKITEWLLKNGGERYIPKEAQVTNRDLKRYKEIEMRARHLVSHLISMTPHFSPGPQYATCPSCGWGLMDDQMMRSTPDLVFNLSDDALALPQGKQP